MMLFKLRRIMLEYGFSQQILQNLTGIRGGTLGDLINSHTKMIPVNALEELCRVTGLPVGEIVKFIPKPVELSFWNRYVKLYNESTFGQYLWEARAIDFNDDFEDFRAAIDTLLNVGDFATGRRKGMKLEDLLEENGLRLSPDGELLEYQEYYRKYDAPDKNPNDTPYNLIIREHVLDKLPSFFDDPATLDNKARIMGLFWIQHPELSYKDDKDNLIPEEWKNFLKNMERRRRNGKANISAMAKILGESREI